MRVAAAQHEPAPFRAARAQCCRTRTRPGAAGVQTEQRRLPVVARPEQQQSPASRTGEAGDQRQRGRAHADGLTPTEGLRAITADGLRTFSAPGPRDAAGGHRRHQGATGDWGRRSDERDGSRRHRDATGDRSRNSDATDGWSRRQGARDDSSRSSAATGGPPRHSGASNRSGAGRGDPHARPAACRCPGDSTPAATCRASSHRVYRAPGA